MARRKASSLDVIDVNREWKFSYMAVCNLASAIFPHNYCQALD
jgi:hypothetical protein